MSSHLTDELNLIIAQSESTVLSLDLEKIPRGTIISILLEDEEEQAILVFKIIQRAKQGDDPANDAKVKLIYALFPQEWIKWFLRAGLTPPFIGRNCSITGSCTKDPDAPMGMTMLKFHVLTLGRNVLWYFEGDADKAWIPCPTIKNQTVLTTEQYEKLKENLEKSPEYAKYHYTEADIEIISAEIQAEEEEHARWKIFTKQALRVETANSVYILTAADENSIRELQKEGDTIKREGRLIYLKVGDRMTYNHKYGSINTSPVVKVTPIKS